MNSLYQIYSVNPIFGVDFTLEAETPNLDQLLQPKVVEDTELLDDHEDTHAIAVCLSSNIFLRIFWLLIIHVLF